MVCALSATSTVFNTTAAAENAALPAWLAPTVHGPALSSVSVLPATVHTLGVRDINDTGRPDVAVAARATGAVPKVWLPGDAKLMACAANPEPTAKACETAGAGW